MRTTQYTLGIETSCDETSAAVASSKGEILSLVTASSLQVHSKYGGVVPEIATRYHIEYIYQVIKKALRKSSIPLSKINFVSVTQGPGLVGALLVGVQIAKAIAYRQRIGIIPVNHLKAHLHAASIDHPLLPYPYVGLLLSGGHTCLVHCPCFNTYHMLGQTRDDAVGEAFDKVAKMLQLGYPGGPLIEERAKKGNSHAIRLPRVYLEKDSLDFSLSGLKTAVLYLVNPPKKPWQKDAVSSQKISISDICASFQQALFEVVIRKALCACKKMDTPYLVVGGGVTANATFRHALAAQATEQGVHVFFPSLKYCGDNAGMIARYGVDLFLKYGIQYTMSFRADPGLAWG